MKTAALNRSVIADRLNLLCDKNWFVIKCIKNGRFLYRKRTFSYFIVNYCIV